MAAEEPREDPDYDRLTAALKVIKEELAKGAELDPSEAVDLIVAGGAEAFFYDDWSHLATLYFKYVEPGMSKENAAWDRLQAQVLALLLQEEEPKHELNPFERAVLRISCSLDDHVTLHAVSDNSDDAKAAYERLCKYVADACFGATNCTDWWEEFAEVLAADDAQGVDKSEN